MDNVNIKSIEFDKSMPLWATDVSIQKLSKLLTTETRLNNKQIKKLTTVITKIASQSREDSKADKARYKNTEKSIASILTSFASIEKGIKEQQALTKETNKILKKNAIKTDTSSKKDSGKPPSDNKTDTGQSSKKTHKGLSEQLAISKQSLGLYKRNSNRAHNTSVKISRTVDHIARLLGGIVKDGVIIRNLPATRQVRIVPIRRGAGGGGDNAPKGYIDRVKDSFKQLQDERKKATRGRVRDSGRGSRRVRPAGDSGMGGMVKTVMNLVKSMAKVGKAMYTVSKIVTGLLGVALLALEGVIAVYNNMADALNKERELLQKGINLRKDGDGDMDGIKLKLAISQSGLTVERGLKSLSENAALVNKMGVKPFLQSVSEMVLGTTEFGSVFTELGVSMETIQDATAEYINTQMRLGRLNDQDHTTRLKATNDYIRQADKMGKVTGLGTDAILDTVKKLNKDAAINMAKRYMSKDASDRVNAFQTTSAVYGEATATMFTRAAVETTGLGLFATEEGKEQITMLNTLGDNLGNDLNDILKGVKTRSVEETNVLMEEFNAKVRAANKARKDANDTDHTSLIMNGGFSAQGIEAYNAFLSSTEVASEGGLTADVNTQATSDQSKAALEVKKEAEKLATAREKVLNSLSDEEAARKALITGNTLLTEGAEMATSALGSFTAILKEATGAIYSLLRTFGLVSKSDDEVKQEKIEEAEKNVSNWDAKRVKDKKKEAESYEKTAWWEFKSDKVESKISAKEFEEFKNLRDTDKVEYGKLVANMKAGDIDHVAIMEEAKKLGAISDANFTSSIDKHLANAGATTHTEKLAAKKKLDDEKNGVVVAKETPVVPESKKDNVASETQKVPPVDTNDNIASNTSNKAPAKPTPVTSSKKSTASPTINNEQENTVGGVTVTFDEPTEDVEVAEVLPVILPNTDSIGKPISDTAIIEPETKNAATITPVDTKVVSFENINADSVETTSEVYSKPKEPTLASTAVKDVKQEIDKDTKLNLTDEKLAKETPPNMLLNTNRRDTVDRQSEMLQGLLTSIDVSLNRLVSVSEQQTRAIENNDAGFLKASS